MRVGYGRVSTRDQHPEAQRDALAAAGVADDNLYIDHGVSGKLARRQQLDLALRVLREGDQLVITKLDRLGRSLKHLIELSEEFQRRGVALVVLDQGIDTSTPAGRLFFHMIGAVAEFEAAMLSERTQDGLAAAKARGRTGGRKPKMGPGQAEHARKLYDQRDADGKPVYSVNDLATKFGVSRSTMYNSLSTTADGDAAP